MDGLNLDWINYYKEMGVALLRYKTDRRELVDRLKKTYARANIAMPILELYNELFDLDPFTVFGLFNRLGMPVETRMKIMSGLAVNIGVPDKLRLDCQLGALVQVKGQPYYLP